MKNFLFSIIFLVCLPLASLSAADSTSVAKGVVIESEDSFLEPLQKRDTALIADQFRYGFHLKDVQEGTLFSLPDISKGLMDSIEVVKPWAVDTVATHGKRKDPKSYDMDFSLVITSFDEGNYVLRPLSLLRHAKDGSTDTLVFKPQILSIMTMPVDTTTYKIHDIKGQVKYPLSLAEILPYVGLAWAIAIIAILIWAFLSRKKSEKGEAARKDPPHLVALRKLDKLRGDKFWSHDKQKYYYSGITDTLREYIDARYGIDAMEMTTAEIFKDLKGKGVPQDLFNEIKTLFETADYVKFAKAYASDEENASSLPSAVRFVTTSYQSLLAEEEAQKESKKGGKE